MACLFLFVGVGDIKEERLWILRMTKERNQMLCCECVVCGMSATQKQTQTTETGKKKKQKYSI